MNRTYGTTYDENLTTKEIAAIARKNFRNATKGDTPLTGWTVSVRYRSFAGGSSIDTKLTAQVGVHARHIWSDDSYAGESDANNVCTVCGVQMIAERSSARRAFWLTAGARDAQAYAERIIAGYNHDGSDMMTDYFDVNFYGHVSVSEATA